MKKKTYSILFLLIAVCMYFGTSCSDDNDNKVKVDEEWKALNDKRFSDSIKVSDFLALDSQSGEGKIYWKKSSIITNSDADKTLRVTVAGNPEFTDTVEVRFEAWYYDKQNKKVVAASTENPSYYSLMANPNKVPYKVCVNRRTTSTSSSTEYYRFDRFTSSSSNYSVIDLRTDGWATLIQDMKTGEEREAIVPYNLGYYASVQAYIPAYTTLWYRIKLLKIIPMSGQE